jgi:osmotically-inducible protein OsmY
MSGAVSRLPAIAAWLLAVLLVAGTFDAVRSQAQDTQAQDKRPIADSTITQRVQNAIAQDRDLANLHIEVRTQDGMVSLTGFVRSLEDIARAGELARAVRGVSGVRNGLQVANRPSRA